VFGILDKMKGAAGALAGTAADAAGAGFDTVKGILDAVGVAAADLETIGYSVRDVEVAVSLPPSVTVFLTRTGDPTDEAFAALLANRSGQTTAWLMIKLTQQAHRWSQKLRFGGRRCRELAIDLGFRPGVRLMFGKDAPGQAPATETETVPMDALSHDLGAPCALPPETAPSEGIQIDSPRDPGTGV
jgi:hypothetical protein